MDINEKTIQIMNGFALTYYESKIIEVLIVENDLGSGEMIKRTDIPRSRFYDVMRSLEKKGFVKVIEKKPKGENKPFVSTKVRLLSGDLIIKNIKSKLDTEVKNKINSIKITMKQVRNMKGSSTGDKE